MRPTSKSQFNKNVKHQLETLDVIRKDNTTLTISLPTQCNPNTASTLCQSNFIDVQNDFCVLKTNVSNVSGDSLQHSIENNDLSFSTFVSTSPKCSSLNNFVSDNVLGNSKIPIPDHLREWAIRNKISHVALKELLSILKEIPDLKNIPKDPRTFLKTPRETILRDINPGKYYHFGLENGLINMLKKVNVSNIPDVINVAINIDGLPLSDSSQSQVYPILCLLTNVDILLPLNIFCIGIYHGYDKPSDFNELLEDFVNEAVNLTLNGIHISDKNFSFKMSMLLFDAVAKASVLQIKGHSGYSSCSKCMQEGEYLDHVVFPVITFTKRTDTDFINQTDPEHHTGHTILQRIPNLGLVTDYMHLICLGVVKKLLVNTWCFGRPPHKLQSRSVNIISDALLNLINYIPNEFVRKPRPIKEAKRYKATDFYYNMCAAGWYVVKFKNEKNIIEVIPSNWIRNFEECFWPLKFGSIKLQTAIKNRSTPENDWKLYPIKVICNKMFTVYKDASKFANETLAQSTSESEQLIVKNTSTKRKKKNNKEIDFSELSSDEKQSDNELPPFPKFKKKDVTQQNNNTECSIIEDNLNIVTNENQNIVENNQDMLISNGFSCLINQNYISSDESSFTVIDNHDISVGKGFENLTAMIGNKDQNYNLSGETVNNQTDTMPEINLSNDIDFGSLVSLAQNNKQKTHISSEVETQILRQLITLNARCKEQGDYLHTIMMVVNSIQEKQDILCKQSSSIAVSSTTNDEFENTCAMLPIANELTLTNFNEILINDRTLYDKMVKMLAMIGGSNFRQSVRRILRKLITNEYAKSFSYTGHKNNKTAFNGTILASLLTKAIHSSANLTDKSIKEIETIASIWLSKANERSK
ncbi:uncharacterized protein LOC126554801 [Aphis gossypii]|uniref:uncharacterized protein LOC126554801 n=1 Tax=Aphis gossypii TaxID=80765 RepID=UPI0021594DBF|nr:uncharacterized protein LOC126554801 [Aphis gossypii]